ncbi:transposable element Tcb1 transposase [Trichonephila clavipes]|nr:transposable element Tcb1 transposase [Trichonephila clavipes]
MDVCKCIVTSWHGGTLNSRRATSPLVRLVEGEEIWEAPDHPQGVLSQNWGETELNRSVTCMVLKATANDRRHIALCHDEFRGPLPIRKQRSVFDQVSEFDRGRIVAYQDCGLSFREIGSRVGRNQTTVMRICDRWMQEGTTDRRGRSHPPQCTTSREDRQIVRMAVTDRSLTSRTVPQHIESVTHHSVSARTIRRRLQQSGLSARPPLLGLRLTQNRRRLRHQWCNGGIRYHSRTPLVCIAGTLNSQFYISEVLEPVVLPYLQGLATAIFQQDNARPDVAHIVQRFFVNHQIELLPWPARSPDLSPIENMWSMVAQRLTQITPPNCHIRSTLATCGSCLVCCTPRTHPKSL